MDGKEQVKRLKTLVAENEQLRANKFFMGLKGL
jgi:DNA mismatch repair protein MSH2